MQDVYAILEFDKIKERIASFAVTSNGKKKVSSLRIIPKRALIDTLQMLHDVQDNVDIHGKMPLLSGDDLPSFVPLAEKGYVLSLAQILHVARSLNCQDELLRYAGKCNEGSLLKSMIESCPTLQKLRELILSIIDEYGEIKDNASPDLAKIRREIAKLKKEERRILSKLVETYAPYLSDGTLTLREGKYVLPVSLTYKNKVKGLILDVSNSGESFFIEPIELVEFDSKKATLEAEEKKEIHRLMMLISKEIGKNREPLLQLDALIAELDFIQAKVLYGEANHGTIADLSDDQTLFLPDARHPLLDPVSVVPNTFRFTKEEKVIVISGPNAGGKTVALKTLGLNCLFFQCGLFVLAKPGAMLPYFKHIYLDIGDYQSLEENLSTFSGHMSNMSMIFEDIGGNDLLLLDEVGTGTSPRQGEALAMAILEFILHKHAYAMVSSHFEAVKSFALSRKDVANASLLFDEKTLTPTYILKMGLPGESYGIEVAKRFGINEEIIARAESYLADQGEFSLTRAIAKLTALAKENEALKQKMEQRERALIKKERELESKQKTLDARRESFSEEMKEEKKRIIEKTIEEIEETIAALREQGEDHLPYSRARKKLEAMIPEEETVYYDEEIAEGEYVTLPDSGLSGKVISLSPKKARIVTRDGLSIEVDPRQCRKTSAPIDKVTPMDGHVLDAISDMKGFSLELNIIGLHVDEAREELDRYLDKCRQKGFKRVRIIHGYGTGALRKLTHEYLKAHDRFVASFEAAGEYEGGSGATIVNLK